MGAWLMVPWVARRPIENVSRDSGTKGKWIAHGKLGSEQRSPGSPFTLLKGRTLGVRAEAGAPAPPLSAWTRQEKVHQGRALGECQLLVTETVA